MIFDYFASLAAESQESKAMSDYPFAALADRCLLWSQDGDKKEARRFYMVQATGTKYLLPPELKLKPDFSRLPRSSWLGIEVDFILETPWFSRDDREFHVLDNPVRKDRVFGVPYLPAASWKGLLRWACRMREGLLYDHLEAHDMKMDGWKEPEWIVHLFGNPQGESKDFRRGALAFYPTWFNTVGFEVINPHSRTCRAGTMPIYYEVVPAETKGQLPLLYAPLPEETDDLKVGTEEIMGNLADAIESLLETYGISAKRTAGWGSARIRGWRVFPGNSNQVHSIEEFKEEIRKSLAPAGGSP